MISASLSFLIVNLFSLVAANYDLYLHYGNSSQQILDKISIDYAGNTYSRTNIVRWNTALGLIFGAVDLNKEEFHDIRNGLDGQYPVRTNAGTYQMVESGINDYSCVAVDSQNGFAYGKGRKHKNLLFTSSTFFFFCEFTIGFFVESNRLNRFNCFIEIEFEFQMN